MLARKTEDHFLKKLDNIESGQLELTMPDGKTRIFQGNLPGPKSNLVIHDWQVLLNMATRGDIGFAEDYKKGLWSSQNLENLFSIALQNDHAIKSYIFGNKIGQWLARFSYLLRINTIHGSKKNIHAHYDLGNDFYKLWLDPTMTYSSALYRSEQDSLSQAQHHKYDRIIDLLNAPSGTLLEVGCGWGGFAERALDKGDYQINGLNLSQEQKKYADQRLSGKANIAFQDYRFENGKFDSIVSIEMFEAVGEKFWPVYFDKIASCLKSGGKAVIQTITIDESRFENYRKTGDFIRSYIFPGGMLPSPERFMEHAQKAGLKVGSAYFFGQDYARTLQQWLYKFDAEREAVLKLGFDDGFIRLWRFYLAACIAGFTTNRTDVMQIELSHA